MEWTMIPDMILFFLLAIVAVASALGMLLSRSAVYSALNLILNFCTVAVLYLLLGAPFIALAQITIYAGAIMVLFLFVIMLLGVEQLRKGSALPWQQTLAIISGLLLLALTAYVIFIRPTTLPQVSPTQLGFGTPGAIGEILFNKYLLPFEVTSVLLLVAMIGAIVLTGKREPKAKT
jgi:NADH-quinone oxidoreductase subunit J